MNRYICIHGHFYQPPRENPWLEAVETQDSAHPFHDWNERITAECYAPNAAARILDDRDTILKIVNNYTSISFNFGPTLLSWLKLHDTETYNAILAADRASTERFAGHGSAIAQAYNHIILPLANARDQETQVIWGLRDFESRFGRKPEGMWLPETAVDTASLETLAAQGIKFTILEPHQARRLAVKAGTAATIDTKRAYRCPLPSGRSIDIVFYDGPISRAVAFEHLLARGEYFALRLAGAFAADRKEPQLVNIATDGETYGHHHRFGDMALAYALDYVEKKELAQITNYAHFLSLHPPTEDVIVVDRTSWSCAHGVERWRSDCGCSTGGGAGWNQKWRTPLRETLDWLRDEVAAIFEREGERLLKDPWEARNDYIDVVLDRSEAVLHRFLERHAIDPVPPARNGSEATTRILKLMEMQRNAMLMFTSCGWFFNDISGIETVQVLHYAARVIQLAGEISDRQLEPEFLERIQSAKSNLPEQGTARQIYETDVVPMRLDLGRVAAHYAVASLFDDFAPAETIYCYEIAQNDFDVQKSGRTRMAIGSITVRSRITHERSSFEFAVLHLGETELSGGVRPAGTGPELSVVKAELLEALQPGGITTVIRLLDQHFKQNPLSIRSLFRDEQRRILNLLCNATLQEAESAFRQLHERYDPLMRFHMRLGIPLPRVLQTAAEFDVNHQLHEALDDDETPLPQLESQFREASAERLSLDESTMMALETMLVRASKSFVANPSDLVALERYDALVGLVRDNKLEVNLRKPQNDYYRMKLTIRPNVESGTAEAITDPERWLALFDALGDKLHISPEAA